MSYSMMISILILSLICLSTSKIHYLSINENDFSPQHLLTFDSSNSNTFYSLIKSNISSYFSIKNRTEFYLIESIDREDFCHQKYCSCSFKCTIELKILSKPEYKIEYINVTINDINDHVHRFPFDQFQIDIPENIDINHRQCYRIPSIVDEDLFETNQIQYDLIGDEHHRFEINQTVGNHLCLFVRNSSLDREQYEKYDHLWIIAQDQFKRQSKMKLIIEVLDVNDNSPRFLTNNTVLHVNETFSGRLICLQAFDPDKGQNGQIIYSFHHLENYLSDYFSLNNQTGCIDIIQPLLLTLIHSRLLLTIKAQDLGSKLSSTLPNYHLIELIIDDINDHLPIIEIKQFKYALQILKNNSNISVKENTIDTLALISISDYDQGIYGEIQLDLFVKSNFQYHQKAFVIKPNSNKHFKLELLNPLDFELESFVDLLIEAKDGGGLINRFYLKIVIENENDREPTFEKDHYYFIINIQLPNTSFNSIFIGQIHATDDDDGDDNDQQSLTYSLNSHLFQINSQTGEIYLIEPLNLRMKDEIVVLNVSVTDGLFVSETTVTIFIQGYNHSPYFEKTEYFFEIYENTPIQTVIGQIVGKDDDSSLTARGTLSYSLRSITSYSEYYFHINSQGEILVTRLTDAEQEQIYQLIVFVKDHGTPSLINQTKLIIKINDINEYCPKLINKSFSHPYLFINREEFRLKKENYLTYQILAFDEDISDQEKIYFQISSSLYSNVFHLTSNGFLILKDLPEQIPSIIEFKFTMSDQFFPQPCIEEEYFLVIIGQTLEHCYSLLEQYQKSIQYSTKFHFQTNKSTNSKTIFIIFLFLCCLLTICIGMIYLLLICLNQKWKRRQSITSKSFYIINSSSLLDGQMKYTCSILSQSSSRTPSAI